MSSLSTQGTEVLRATQDISEATINFFERAHTLDICAVTETPNQPEPIKGMMVAYFGVLKRGGKLRLLTEISARNTAYCKEVIRQGVEIRHLEGIVGNFAISEGEYLASLGTGEFDPRGPVLHSNDGTFVKHHHSIFDMLWNSAVSADQRISEIELGEAPAKFEVLYDPTKIWNTLAELIRGARREVLLLLPTVNTFHRQEELKLFELLREASGEKQINVRVLTAMDSSVESKIADEKAGSLVQYQRLSPESGEESVKILVVDREKSLLVEIKNDSVKDLVNAMGVAIYSTSRPTVLSNVSSFERFWTDSKMVEEIAIRRNSLPSSMTPALSWEITPAKFRCLRCGKNVENEIRIYEPGAMQAESHGVSKAMREKKAGWIPFCFDCISTHPVLKPSWLVILQA